MELVRWRRRNGVGSGLGGGWGPRCAEAAEWSGAESGVSSEGGT